MESNDPWQRTPGHLVALVDEFQPARGAQGVARRISASVSVRHCCILLGVQQKHSSTTSHQLLMSETFMLYCKHKLALPLGCQHVPVFKACSTQARPKNNSKQQTLAGHCMRKPVKHCSSAHDSTDATVVQCQLCDIAAH